MVKRTPKRVPGVHLGMDENGLGPRLGPLIVTATVARLDDQGASRLDRKLPATIRADLDDSKALVSCHEHSIAEAWARVLTHRMTGTWAHDPEQLLRNIAGGSVDDLQPMCPPGTRKQCWDCEGEGFSSSDEQVERVARHLVKLDSMGVVIQAVQSEVICTGKLNSLKAQGIHRFSADLHAMERLFLSLCADEGSPAESEGPVSAVCGKVGGIGKYEPFFGPLSGRLRTALDEGRDRSSYYFPGLGTLHFVRDADAIDPLVMLASLVGKYLRELLMGRIARFYRSHVDEETQTPSGYHDPVTARFVEQTTKARKKLRILPDCFERRPAEP